MWQSRHFISFFVISACIINVNNSEDNKILLRRKRYLTFPEGSNFVVTLSFVKALMFKSPKGFITLGECDVPFKLPSDTRLYRKYYNMHYRQRRDLYSHLETAFNSLNLNGISCMKRILCEIEEYTKLNTTSMIKDMLGAIFTFTELENLKDHKYYNYCHETTFTNCNISILDLILRNF